MDVRRKRRGQANGCRLALESPADLKRKLDEAAEKSGRSQSQEAELRLERSFEREELLPDVLTLAYGKPLADILIKKRHQLAKFEARHFKRFFEPKFVVFTVEILKEWLASEPGKLKEHFLDRRERAPDRRELAEWVARWLELVDQPPARAKKGQAEL